MELKPRSAATDEPQDETMKADPERMEMRPVTNIMVRAKKPDGSFGPVDLVHLDKRSLKRWLAADAERAARTVMVLLRHPLD